MNIQSTNRNRIFILFGFQKRLPFADFAFFLFCQSVDLYQIRTDFFLVILYYQQSASMFRTQRPVLSFQNIDLISQSGDLGFQMQNFFLKFGKLHFVNFTILKCLNLCQKSFNIIFSLIDMLFPFANFNQVYLILTLKFLIPCPEPPYLFLHFSQSNSIIIVKLINFLSTYLMILWLSALELRMQRIYLFVQTVDFDTV